MTTTKLAAAILGGFPLFVTGALAPLPSAVWSDMPESMGSGPTLAVPAPPPVAEVPLPSGGSLAFLDTGEGAIGVGELSVRGAPAVSVAMIARFRATPLELFLAAAPRGTTEPTLLRQDHYAYQRRSGWPARPPRDLAVELANLDLDDPGVEPFACDSLGFNWKDGWAATFDGLTAHWRAGFIHQLHSTADYTFYPGGYYNADGSITGGFNANTYLGACSGDEHTAVTVVVQRRIAYQTEDGPVASWTGIQEIPLNNQEKYTFHSNIPASFRGHVSADVTVEHFGAGVAYNKAMPTRTGS
jgi:hypothetical protein